MRILRYSSQRNDYMYQWNLVHIVDELERNGVIFENFDPEIYKTPDQAISKLKILLKEKRFDLFMTGYGHTYISPEILDELKCLGIPSLLFCSDNLLIPYEHLEISKFFDLVWLTSVETEYLFKKCSAKTIFLPYAANPNIYRGPILECINKVIFIGNPYGSRANMLNLLALNAIKVDLYYGDSDRQKAEAAKAPDGRVVQIQSLINMMKFPIGRTVLLGALKQRLNGANGVMISPHIKRFSSLSFDHMYEAYARYAICLTSTAARNTGVLRSPVNVINLRSFEVPMSGGLQFCAYSKELAEYFEEGREIIFYRDKDEMVDKAQYFTSGRVTQEIARIRELARKRALAEHTWTNRFNKVFEYLGLPQLAIK